MDVKTTQDTTTCEIPDYYIGMIQDILLLGYDNRLPQELQKIGYEPCAYDNLADFMRRQKRFH